MPKGQSTVVTAAAAVLTLGNRKVLMTLPFLFVRSMSSSNLQSYTVLRMSLQPPNLQGFTMVLRGNKSNILQIVIAISCAAKWLQTEVSQKSLYVC